MKRQPIDNGTWFDLDTAKEFAEDTWWNGSNHISCATNCQWEHERLYRTRNKRWVLNHWSQMQGSAETWVEINDKEAAEWLVKNHEDHPDVAEQIAELEI